MDDRWLVLHAEDMVKDWDGWRALYKAEPSNWETEDYQTIACIAQQLLLEREEQKILRRRRQASSKRAANREKTLR